MVLHAVFTFLVGLAIGSFLNVCIFRLPKRASVVTPGSSCPSCGHRLSWKENIPVVSYLQQRARCRHCQGRISWIYPVVEVSTACLFMGLFLRFGTSPPFFVNAFFFSALIVLMVIDLNERILPNRLTIGGTLAGLACAPFQAGEILGVSGGDYRAAFLFSVAGSALGGGTLWLVAELYYRVRKEEGLGFGDVKMMFMVGAFVGWRFVWPIIFLGSILGTVIGGTYIYILRKGGRYELPYGSFLGIAAIIIVFWVR